MKKHTLHELIVALVALDHGTGILRDMDKLITDADKGDSPGGPNEELIADFQDLLTMTADTLYAIGELGFVPLGDGTDALPEETPIDWSSQKYPSFQNECTSYRFHTLPGYVQRYYERERDPEYQHSQVITRITLPTTLSPDSISIVLGGRQDRWHWSVENNEWSRLPTED